MFVHSRVRFVRKRETKGSEEDVLESPRFEVSLQVRNARGEWAKCRGRLGISGFYFHTNEILLVGQRVEARIALLGLGTEVQTSGRVVHVILSSSRVGVSVRFEEIPFETERMIARWLDLLCHAHQPTAAA